jgi:hypothetical protein
MAGVTGPPRAAASSGATKSSVPTSSPRRSSRPKGRAAPRSTSRTRRSTSSTLSGQMSRCARPVRCRLRTADSRPTPRRAASGPDSVPSSSTTSSSAGPSRCSSTRCGTWARVPSVSRRGKAGCRAGRSAAASRRSARVQRGRDQAGRTILTSVGAQSSSDQHSHTSQWWPTDRRPQASCPGTSGLPFNGSHTGPPSSSSIPSAMVGTAPPPVRVRRLLPAGPCGPAGRTTSWSISTSSSENGCGSCSCCASGCGSGCDPCGSGRT